MNPQLPVPLPAPAQMPAAAPPPAGPDLWPVVVDAIIPIIGLCVVVPALWLVFRKTWRELDVEAHEHQRKTLASGRYDMRPIVLFIITALVLTYQEYFGGRDFYAAHFRPYFHQLKLGYATLPFGLPSDLIDIRLYDELYSYGWWTFTRVFGYVVFPLVVWKIIFPRDSLLDMGLRVRGVLAHSWIYLLCLAVVVPALLIVAESPDFGNYYPFYKKSSRSWFDFLAWEAMYLLQFLGLEIFFRGFWLAGLRKTLGSGAIFAMCVPYCMIHYGKPYLETMGAVVAGIALGSLAMRTKSIYLGFLVHVTVALTMDLVSLTNRNAMPTVWWPPQ